MPAVALAESELQLLPTHTSSELQSETETSKEAAPLMKRAEFPRVPAQKKKKDVQSNRMMKQNLSRGEMAMSPLLQLLKQRGVALQGSYESCTVQGLLFFFFLWECPRCYCISIKKTLIFMFSGTVQTV